MNYFLLTLILMAISGCQSLQPPAKQQSMPSETMAKEKESRERDTRAADGEFWDELPDPPVLPHGKSLSLKGWMNFQLYVASLPRQKREQLVQLVKSNHQREGHAASKLQWIVAGFHHPPGRNMGALSYQLKSLAQDPSLNADGRLYAQWLGTWVDQAYQYELEMVRLRQALSTERKLKTELEEKIKRLSDIEETLNLRQRGEEP
jgi:hypothetical protein